MKMMHVMASLLLASSLAVTAQARQQSNEGGAFARLGTQSPAGSHLPSYRTEGREVIAPPWSAACMTDHGPSECGEPMWFYGSSGALTR